MTYDKCMQLRDSMKDEKNPRWKGDDVKYRALHQYIERRLRKPKMCPVCRQPRKLELSNKSRTYKRSLSDWEWLCRKCHRNKDAPFVNKKYKLKIKDSIWNRYTKKELIVKLKKHYAEKKSISEMAKLIGYNHRVSLYSLLRRYPELKTEVFK